MSVAASARSRRSWLIFLVLAIVLVALVWWFWPSSPTASGARSGGLSGPSAAVRPFRGLNEAVPVRVASVKKEPFEVYLKALGTVQPLNTVNVRSRVGGELVELTFEEGQWVKQNDLLAKIDARPYRTALNQAKGTLLQTQAQLKNAEIDLKRYRGLFAQDSIARQVLDTQEAEVDRLRGALLSQQAAVDEAQLNLSYTEIRAPIEGRVGLKQVDVGNLVTANDSTPLVVITQMQPMNVSFSLPQADVHKVTEPFRAGKKLLAEAWDRGEKAQLETGTLQSIDNLIDAATGTLMLKARFANPHEQLLPNQFVNVRLRVAELQDALTIPSAAIQLGNNGTFAYVVNADNKVEIRNIVLGPADGETTVVLEGLAENDRIVLEGTDRLRTGSTVEIVNDESSAPATETVPVQDEQAAPNHRRQGAERSGAARS